MTTKATHGGLLDAMRAELEPQLAEIRGRLEALEARPLPSRDPLRAVPKYGPPPSEDPERLRQLVEELSEPQPGKDSLSTEQDGSDPSCILNREASSERSNPPQTGRGREGQRRAIKPEDVTAGRDPHSTSAAGGGEHSDDCPGDARRIELGRDHCCLLQSAAKRTPPEPAERCGACVGSGTIYSASLTPFDCRACHGTGRKPQPAAEGSGEMVPTVWESNGEAGDSTELCSVCRASVAGPHTREECARGSAQSYFLALDKALETEAERDAVRRELEEERYKKDGLAARLDEATRGADRDHAAAEARADAAERRAEKLAAVVEAARRHVQVATSGTVDGLARATSLGKLMLALADADVESGVVG